MTALSKFCLSRIPSWTCSLLSLVLVWTGIKFAHLSVLIDETWPKP